MPRDTGVRVLAHRLALLANAEGSLANLREKSQLAQTLNTILMKAMDTVDFEKSLSPNCELSHKWPDWLTAGARGGLIDRNGNGEDHGDTRDIVIREANAAEYQLLEQDDFVKHGMDYFLVFAQNNFWGLLTAQGTVSERWSFQGSPHLRPSQLP